MDKQVINFTTPFHIDALMRRIIKIREELFVGILEERGEFLPTVGTLDPKYIKIKNTVALNEYGNPTKYTLDETIALVYAGCDGEFPLPSFVISYISDMDSQGFIKPGNFTFDEKRLKKGAEIVESLTDAGFCYYAAVAVAGAFFVECGWNVNVVNRAELGGKGTNGTGGWINAGEGLFGLTFWNQKCAIIKKLPKIMSKHGISSNSSVYNNPKSPHLSDLNLDEWMEVFKAYLSGKFEKVLTDKDIDKNLDDEEMLGKVLAASYVFKAGGSGPEWDVAVKRSGVYRATHAKQNGGSKNVYDGLALQILMSFNLSRYINKKPIKSFKELLSEAKNG